MYDLTKADDLMHDAAEWLLRLPDPTAAQISAAATLLLEASRIRRGQAALTATVNARPAMPDFGHLCITCGNLTGTNGDNHQDNHGHVPMYRADGVEWEWDSGSKAWRPVAATARRAAPAASACELHLVTGCTACVPCGACGRQVERLTLHSPEGVLLCGGCKLADVSRETSAPATAPGLAGGAPADVARGYQQPNAQVQQWGPVVPAVDVSRETSAPATAPGLAGKCLYEYAGYGCCLRDIGHEGDHRDANGYTFADLPDAVASGT